MLASVFQIAVSEIKRVREIKEAIFKMWLKAKSN